MTKSFITICFFVTIMAPAKSQETIAVNQAIKQKNLGIFFYQGTTEVKLFRSEGIFKLFGDEGLYTTKDFEITVTPHRRYTLSEVRDLIMDSSEKSGQTGVLMMGGWKDGENWVGNISFDRGVLKFTDILTEICRQNKRSGWLVEVQTSTITVWEHGLSKPKPTGTMTVSVVSFIK